MVRLDVQSLSLHPLVQTVELETLTEDEKRSDWSWTARLLSTISPPASWKDDCRDHWSLDNDKTWMQILEHVRRLEALAEALAEKKISVEFIPDFEIQVVNAHAAHHEYEPAIQKCASLRDKLDSPLGVVGSLGMEAQESLSYLFQQSR
jgi:hypothetical protein